MTSAKLPQQRLWNQRVSATNFEDPAATVRWLGAVQAQEYHHSLWAIGLRTRRATQGMVERAIADRSIVRTWPMRGTLHFVAAEDVRWMLELMASRVARGRSALYQRRFGLDQQVLHRARDVVAKALQGGKRLTRPETYRALEQAGIPTGASRGLHIVWWLAHDGLICFGPHAGKQPTLVLLEEWIPGARRLERDEALAELARRYFSSHGPATVHDLAWWSGLPLADVRRGLALAGGELESRDVGSGRYWGPSPRPRHSAPSRAYLLPAFDEYTVAYRDRSALVSHAGLRRARSVDILLPAIVVNGRVVGTWTRTLNGESVRFALNPFGRLGPTTRRAVASAARRHAAFLQLTADGS
jgi:Winged helix DNA-binding domain